MICGFETLAPVSAAPEALFRAQLDNNWPIANISIFFVQPLDFLRQFEL